MIAKTNLQSCERGICDATFPLTPRERGKLGHNFKDLQVFGIHPAVRKFVRVIL